MQKNHTHTILPVYFSIAIQLVSNVTCIYVPNCIKVFWMKLSEPLLSYWSHQISRTIWTIQRFHLYKWSFEPDGSNLEDNMQSEQEVTEPVVRPCIQRERHPPANSSFQCGCQQYNASGYNSSCTTRWCNCALQTTFSTFICEFTSQPFQNKDQQKLWIQRDNSFTTDWSKGSYCRGKNVEHGACRDTETDGGGEQSWRTVWVPGSTSTPSSIWEKIYSESSKGVVGSWMKRLVQHTRPKNWSPSTLKDSAALRRRRWSWRKHVSLHHFFENQILKMQQLLHWTWSGLDPGQVQTDILCSQKVEVAHHITH